MVKRCTPENRETYWRDVIESSERQTAFMAAMAVIFVLAAGALILFGPACDSAAWR